MSINREILRLSIPAIVSNITVPLLGLCDTAVSGHLGTDLYLAAIAVGSVMLNVVFWIFGFLRMGTTGLTANALGEKNQVEIRRILTRSLFIAVVAGMLLIIFRYPLMVGLLKFIGCDPNVEVLVKDYFQIRIWGAPALLATMAVTGWFVGMQNTVWPLIISVGMNIVNIIISLILVFLTKWGFNGIAAGTMMANWIGLAIAVVSMILFSKGGKLFCKFSEIFVDRGLVKFFNVNSSLFIRSFCIIAVTMGVTAAGATLGALTLAINVVIMQFFQFFSFFIDGFAFSGEAMVGLYQGERNYERMKLSVRTLLYWTFGLSLAFTLLYGFFGNFITGLLTDSETVRTGVGNELIYVILLPLLSAWAFIYDGFYIGVTKTGFMMYSALIGSVIFFLIAFTSIDGGELQFRPMNNDAIWIAFLSYLSLRGLFLALMWGRISGIPNIRKTKFVIT